MLVALAKLGTREMVGQFSYGLAVTAPIIVLTGMNLRAAQATDARDRYSFESYLGLRLVSVAISLGAVLALAVADRGRGLGWVLLIMGAAKGTEAISDVCFGLLQRHERMDVIAKSMIVKGLLSLATFAAAVHIWGRVEAAVLALALTWGLVLVAYDFPRTAAILGRNPKPAFQVWSLWSLTRLAFPLGVVMFLYSLCSSMPRYFIERLLGLGDLGVFSAVTYVIVALTTVLGALGQAAMPRLAGLYGRGDAQGFLRLLRLLTAMGIGLALASTAAVFSAGSTILAIMYRPDYADAQPVFLWAAAGSSLGLISAALGYGLTAMRIFRPQVPLMLLVTGVTLGMSAMLIPRFGLLGAIATGAAASAVHIAGQLFLLRGGLIAANAHRRGTLPAKVPPVSS